MLEEINGNYINILMTAHVKKQYISHYNYLISLKQVSDVLIYPVQIGI